MPIYAKYSGITGTVGIVWPLLAPLGTAAAPSYSFAIDPNTGMFSSGPDTLNFSTGGVERVQINSSGWVGVGTTPTSPLDIQANTNLTSAVYIHNSAGNAVVYLGADDQVNPPAINNGSQIELSGKWSSSFPSSFRTFGRIGAFKENATPEDQSGYLALYSRPSVGLLTERVRITSAGAVGINAPTPVTMLDINGDISSVASRAGATLSTFVDTANGSIVLQRKARGTIAAPTAVQSGDLISYWVGRGYGATAWSGDRAAMVFRASENWTDAAQGSSIAFNTTAVGTTSTTEKMRIDSDGQVLIQATAGIGLDIAQPTGVARVRSTTGTNACDLRINNTGGTFYFGLDSSTGSAFGSAYSGNVWHAGNYPIRFATNNLERMRIDNAGNVGINTTPNVWTNVFQQRALQIGSVASLSVIDTGAGNVQTNLACNAYDFSSGPFYQVSAAASAYRQLSGSHVWYNAGTGTAGNTITFSERMRIDGSGNVGIGTNNPGDALVITRSGANTILTLQTYGSVVPLFRTQKANGTSASPTQVVSGDDLLRIGGTGYTSGGAFTADTGRITFQASENFTSTANGTAMLFSTVANGSTTLTERMRIDNAGNVGVKATSFGTSAAAALGIANGTEPSSSVADQIVIGSVDLTAGNTIPYFRSEGTGMTGAGITNTTVTHKIAIKVNGTVYYLLATTNGT